MIIEKSMYKLGLRMMPEKFGPDFQTYLIDWVMHRNGRDFSGDVWWEARYPDEFTCIQCNQSFSRHAAQGFTTPAQRDRSWEDFDNADSALQPLIEANLEEQYCRTRATGKCHECRGRSDPPWIVVLEG